MKATEIKKAMVEDLKASGITGKYVTSIKVKPMDASATAKLFGDHKKIASYGFPYFDIKGKPTKFIRAKVLGTGPFGAKPQYKYIQLPNTSPEVYLAPFVKWESIAKDVGTPIYITEGEKKAICACINGVNTIGLGGVWSFMSKKRNISFLPVLDLFEWEDREVYIAFDSDAVYKPNVMAAMFALNKMLSGRGAEVYYILLPEAGDGKNGLDDYIVKHGVKKFLDLPVEAFEYNDDLIKLNDEVALIHKPCMDFFLLEHEIFVNKDKLVGTVFADRSTYIIDGNGDEKRVNAAGEWVKWPFRRTHKQVVYRPGLDKELEDGSYNIWNGWGSVPKRGDVSLFTQLVNHIFDGFPQERKWFIQWLAYPIQNPGVKMFSTVLLHGVRQGTGKSLLGYHIGRIYGDNYQEIKNEDLHSAFNSWAKNKQFILADEITSSNRKRDADRLKQLVTREKIEINEKYQPPYVLQDCINYMFVSNHPDAVYIEKFDRRFFIFEVINEPMPLSFFSKYDKWYKTEEGVQALHYYLLNVDCSDFNPYAPAPVTKAKANLRDMVASEIEHWVSELYNNPVLVLKRRADKELWTTDELLKVYNPDGMKRISSSGLCKALRSEGFPLQRPIKIDGVSIKVWIVRNFDKWEKAKHKDLVAHYVENK